MNGTPRRKTQTVVADFSFTIEAGERDRTLQRTSRFRAHDSDETRLAPSLAAARHRDDGDSADEDRSCPTH